jgi:hypothetical protein
MKNKQDKPGSVASSSGSDGGKGRDVSKGTIDREGQIKLGVLISRMYETDLQKPAPDTITDLVKQLIRRKPDSLTRTPLMSPDDQTRDLIWLPTCGQARHIAVRERRSRGRSRSETGCERLPTSIISAGHKHAGLAFHHPATCSALNIASAGARSRRDRHVRRKHEVAARTGSRLEFEELRAALAQLPDDQREAVILVASGSREEAMGDLRARRRHHQEPRQSRAATGSPN